VTLVRATAEAAMEFAKRTGKAVILIGHVTKDGAISGPKALEHLVDTVLFLEGSRYEDYRILRSLKNRFGATDEIALFRMTEKGLEDLANPGLEFADSKNALLSGSALTVTMEGSRPIVVEIEALTTYTKFGYPKRSSRGIPQGKLDLLLAVLSKWTSIKTESHDVYLNVARGMTLSEPGSDLAAIAAIASSRKEKPLGKTAWIGEVSLTGTVKNVFRLQKRVDEAAKLGFERIVVPKGSGAKLPKNSESKLFEVSTVAEAEKLVG
jgi:DNA repair protein RadA/Sms